ncbi:kelch-like protein 40 [Drosophila serrata]|uniref:kelch-like protein 40 n=1 Tax=Drosophila serrata TaxID=7274 RepID=UPI000A1D39B9|nr:kelch-like protein 40 [Drosophila serrata]
MELWLASSFKNLTEEDEFTDCCISVESIKFRCHKVILGVASDFFKHSFLSGFKESSTGEIVLTYVKADTFKKFRLYVYTYSKETLASYSNEDVISLMECADMWMVEPLKKACHEIIQKRLPQMTFSDLLLYFEFAQNVDDKALIKDTALYMNKRYSLDGKTVSDEVYQLGAVVFRDFLKEIKQMTEITRYQMVEKYVTIHGLILNLHKIPKWEFNGLANNSEIQKSDDYANPNPFKIEKLNLPFDTDPRPKTINMEYVQSLLKLVNFKRMSAKQFYDGPGKSKLITFEEKFNILYSIVGDNCNC